MTRSRTSLAAAFLALLALLAAGCGSDSSVSVSEGDNSSASDADTNDSSDSSAAEAALNEALENADDSLDQAEAVLGDEYADCIAIGQAFRQLGALALGGTIEDVNEVVDELDGRIPSEIEDDFAIVSSAFAEFVDGGIFSGSDVMDTPEFEAASDNLEAYVNTECETPGG